MYEPKTQPTEVSVDACLAGITDEARRTDCKAIAALMMRVTGCAPRMWGPSIVGFDSYHYKYASGHEGDACVLGFSSGRAHISVYLTSGYEAAETKALLSQLGRHKIGKACLYIKRLSDVHLQVLEQLIAGSVAETRRRYPPAGA